MNLHAFIFDFLLDVHHLIFLSLGLLAGTKIGRKLEQRKALRGHSCAVRSSHNFKLVRLARSPDPCRWTRVLAHLRLQGGSRLIRRPS